MLEKSLPDKSHREEQLRREGYPAYTTQVGWMCHSPEQIRRLCNAFKARGFKAFKIKVGTDVARDRERLRFVFSQFYHVGVADNLESSEQCARLSAMTA